MYAGKMDGSDARSGDSIEVMEVDEHLRGQDWELIREQLTAFAYRRIRYSSWERAQDLAQEAITQAFEAGRRARHYKVWDPASQGLMDYLTSRVIGLAANSLRRHRHCGEVALDYEAEQVTSGALPDEQIDRRDYARRFREALYARIEGDELARELADLMSDGVVGEGKLSQATGRSVAQIRAANKRIQRHTRHVLESLDGGARREAAKEEVQ